MPKFSVRKRLKKEDQQPKEVFTCDDPRVLWEATKFVLDYRKKITPIKDDEEYVELFEKMEDLMDKDKLADSEVEEVEILQDRLFKYEKSFSDVVRENYTNWQGRDCNITYIPRDINDWLIDFSNLGK